MRKIVTIILCVLLCVGAVGGTFALAKKLDANISIEQPNGSSTQAKPSVEEESTSKPPGEEDSEPETVKVWRLCKTESDLAVGDKIVIVAQSGGYALSTTQNTSNRSMASVAKNDDTINITDEVQIITLEAGVIENTFAFNVGTGYLYAPSSASNHLKKHAAIDENSCWKITFESTNVATTINAGCK